jgi:hypothetical protein
LCIIPKSPPIPVPVERQAEQVPQAPVDATSSLNARRRRGMWASIMTSPQGIGGPPSVTGTPGA